MLISGHKRRYLFAVLICIAVSVFVTGCGRSPGGGAVVEDERVIAKVNDYEIYASDLTYSLGLAESSEQAPSDTPEGIEALQTKLKLMDQLITRKILVQEAQKQDFDKQGTFMKEIERYWEQALLKFLINKRSKELMESVSAEEWEVRNEYRRKKRQVFAKLVFFEDVSAADELSASDGNFDEVKQKLADKIVLEESAQWWETGDLPRYIEDYLFALSPGDVSDPLIYEDNWAVMQVLEIKDVQIESLEEIRRQIVQDIKKAKSEKMLAEWIEGLKKDADIDIDYTLLRVIEIKKPENNR